MLNKIKNYLNIKWDEKDFLIEIWISEAKEFIKSEIWEFERTEKEIIQFSKFWKIFLNGINIKINKIEENFWTFLSPSFKTFWWNYRFLNNILYLHKNSEFKIYFSVWFEELPLNIKQAIFLYVKEKFEFENWKIKTEIVDMDRVDFELDKSVENKIFSLISKYKAYDFSA